MEIVLAKNPQGGGEPLGVNVRNHMDSTSIADDIWPDFLGDALVPDSLDWNTCFVVVAAIAVAAFVILTAAVGGGLSGA